MILWIIVFILVLVLVFRSKKEGMTNKAIPANLFQTWKTKSLPPFMKACVSRLKKQNPEFNYFLYDDEDCRSFIVQHFETDVLEAFDRLIPGAYKADLWRYCVLYIKGGIYLDIKFECHKDFKLVELLDKPHYVLDRKEHADPGKQLVYNGLMVTPAKNAMLKTCIERIVKNVQQQEFGFNPLYPTGPGLLGEVLEKDPDIDLTFSADANYILLGKRRILEMYPEYRDELHDETSGKNYTYLWKKGTIYRP